MGRRSGFTLTEMLIVIGIITLLCGLVISAVQKTRAAAARAQCSNHLRQIGVGLHQFHDTHRVLPPGTSSAPFDLLSWRVRIAPFLELSAYWEETVRQYAANPNPGLQPRHANIGVVVPVFGCPGDSRVDKPQSYPAFPQVALSSYLGVSGLDYTDKKGVFYANSRTRLIDIKDGLSNTLMVGERPPSNDFTWGWLYAGDPKALDHTLGVRETRVPWDSICPPGPYHFEAKQLGVPCGFMHFWSVHDGGAHFLLADGSVQFFTYAADSLLPALATRNEGDLGQLPF